MLTTLLRPSMRANNQISLGTNKERRRGPPTRHHPSRSPCKLSTSTSNMSITMMESINKCIKRLAMRALAPREGRSRGKGRWIRLKGSRWCPPLRLSWWPNHQELVNRETLRCPQQCTISHLTYRITSRSIETKILITNRSMVVVISRQQHLLIRMTAILRQPPLIILSSHQLCRKAATCIKCRCQQRIKSLRL